MGKRGKGSWKREGELARGHVSKSGGRTKPKMKKLSPPSGRSGVSDG